MTEATDAPTPVEPLNEQTHWLTNAREAETGMDVIAYDEENDELVRQEIEKITLEPSGTVLFCENGTTVTAEHINQSDRLVVE